MWDLEVDVASVGTGPGAVASALATMGAGASVLLATPLAETGRRVSGVAVQQRVRGFLGSWQRPDLDGETDEYLTSLGAELGSSGVAADRRMTVRTVRTVAADSPPQPFIGSRLGAWNAACLESPYGMLFSSVCGWRTAKVHSEDGHQFEVMSVGTASSAEVAAGFDVSGWLQRQAADRDVRVQRFTSLERIVFENGRVIGVELATADGVMSVRIRHGLALSASATDADDLPHAVVGSDVDDLQVCIVGKTASRFLRVELVGTTTHARPMCNASGRRFRDALREVRALPSGAGACGKPR